MKFEFIIVIVTLFIIYNIYSDGKYSKWYYLWKKEIQMAMVALVGISIYLTFKRSPAHCKNILLHANNVVKYMPIDKSTMGMISPILDFTSSSRMPFLDEVNSRLNPGHKYNFTQDYLRQEQPPQQQMGGVPKATKRSVSETKKKYVASMQNWKCGECQSQLNAWFEVDHKQRLEYGGSNEVSNLVALCRECHGQKTAMENM
jgi:hypothetical protein